MSLKRLKKIEAKDPQLTQVQNNIELVISPIVDKIILDGIMIKDIILTAASATKVNHKLGRKALGYIIVKQNANSIIWDTNLTTKHIELNCSVDVTISIWVF